MGPERSPPTIVEVRIAIAVMVELPVEYSGCDYVQL